MKLGILTFHSAHNYGAVLQAYGLQEYLKQHGHDVYVIDYRPDYITRCYPKDGSVFWKNANLLECVRGIYNYYVHSSIRHHRWDNFEHFITSRLNLYPYHVGMDFHEFDAVFIGSDQVWSKALTGGQYDPVMFGSGFLCKIISYAPSSTTLSLTDADKDFLRTHLDDFHAISVRETALQRIYQPFTAKKIDVVVDPTLLAGRLCFDRIASESSWKRPYVLIYEINGHHEVYETAKRVAKMMDADLLELTNGMRLYHRRIMKEDATPGDFINLFKNAACVLTTSFHGTVFSLMFNTPFYTILQGTKADSRMVSLLSLLDMMDRTIVMGETPKEVKPLENDTQEKIRNLVKSSEDFITVSLQ